jgi:hypothetical protein
MNEIAIVGDIFSDIIAGGVSNLPSWGADTPSASGIGIYPGKH